MLKFMKFIQKCSEFYITFGGTTGETWLANLFFDSQVEIGRDGPKLQLTIHLHKDFLSDLDGDFTFVFSRNEFSSDTYLELRYGQNNNNDEHKSRIKQLNKLHSSFLYQSTNFQKYRLG